MGGADRQIFVLENNTEGPMDNANTEVKPIVKRPDQDGHDLAPISFKDLAVMQQLWTSHEFPDTLVDALKIGQAYTAMMGNSFDQALDIVNLLKESDRLNVGHMQVQIDYASQKGGSGSEELQDGRLGARSSS